VVLSVQRRMPFDLFPALCGLPARPRRRHNIGAMATVDLTDDEQAALVAYVLDRLREEKFPRAPRLNPVRSALGKLDPASIPQPRPERPPLPEAPMRSRGGRRMRR
jgi:hypothetical protein